MANTNQLNSELLSGLTEEERSLVLKTLADLSKGNNKGYEELIYEDYDEIPVDVETFLYDKNYLGNGLINAEGKFTVFPYWVETLKKIFPNNIDTAYNTLVLTGGIGLGKSFMAVLCIAYLLHRMLCLKDPYLHYGLQPIDKITFSFINVTIDAAKGVGWDKIQQLFQSSPWFMSHGTVSGRSEIIWTPDKRIELVVGSSNNVIIGRALYANFTDEVNFGSMTSDVEKIKAKQKHLISQVDARMQSRFMKGTYLPTLNIIASSKSSDQSFLDTYIEMKKKNESKTTLIIDEPQWVIRTDKDSKEKFYVAVGNKFLASEILPLNASETLADEYRAKGYQLLKVPIGYYETFNDNVELALTDIAGISTTSALKYISGVRLNEIKTNNYKNLFNRDIIEVGTGDDLQYSNFFDLSKVSAKDKGKPLYIHLDMSKTGDKTGIAGVWIDGKKPSSDGEASKEVYYKAAFSVSIKAPKGYEISFEKNRNFVRWLKKQGFNIKSVSCDTYQSAQIQQQLRSDGFEVKTLSVDRLENVPGTNQKVCLPYAYFKTTIYEKRLMLYDKCDLLTDEIIGLEKEPDGHIEHPMGGTQGCFTGDTKISLVDGRELSLVELVDEFNKGKQNYVYSFNEKTKRIEPKLIEKAWCTLRDASLVEVTLDNGEKLRCTPNHKFMLRDSTYCEAQNLKTGDSLMPLYRKYLTEAQSPLYEYRLYYEPMEDKWHYEHRRFCEEVLSDSKQIVHHKNCNKKDNSPCNLIYCSKGEHQKIHAELCTGAHSPEAEKKRSLSISQWHENAKGTEAYTERSKKLHDANLKQHGKTEADYLERQDKLAQQRLHGQELRKKAEETKQRKAEYIQAIENLYGVVWEDLSASERSGYGVKFQRFNHPESIESMRNAISAKHSLGEYENAKTALARCNQESKKLKELCPEVDPERFFDIFGFEYASLEPKYRAPWITKYRKIVCKEILNHRVVSVEILDYTEDVYDLTVQDNHNFALTAGVFVHNSKDQVDALCGSIYSASLNIDDYSYNYGEDVTSILENNTLGEENIRQQISVAFEQSLQGIFTPNSVKEVSTEDQNNFVDFGNGKAAPYTGSVYSNDGILIW